MLMTMLVHLMTPFKCTRLQKLNYKCTPPGTYQAVTNTIYIVLVHLVHVISLPYLLWVLLEVFFGGINLHDSLLQLRDSTTYIPQQFLLVGTGRHRFHAYTYNTHNQRTNYNELSENTAPLETVLASIYNHTATWYLLIPSLTNENTARGNLIKFKVNTG